MRERRKRRATGKRDEKGSRGTQGVELSEMEEGNNARVAYEMEKRKKMEEDKTEDEATKEEGRRERNKGGMTTRMARSYSLGYNSRGAGTMQA